MTVNDLFKGINEILKRDIIKAFNNETNIAINDKFEHKDNHSETQITIQHFSFDSNKFPVIFKPGNDSVAEDKEITSIKGDFDDSASIYKIKNEDEPTTEAAENLKKENSKPTTESTPKKSPETKISVLLKLYDDKLIKDASTQPILTNV